MDNKKTLILMILGVITLICAIGGVTYAFFVSQFEDGKTDIDITTSSTDSLSFGTGDEINININQTNFGIGAGNISDDTTATAVLTANNHTNSASYNYYLYLNITNNELTYTTTEKTPELILKVTNPNNQVVTSISGLTYNSELQGFDITSSKGVITIANNYAISTTSTTTQNWKIEVMVVNLDTDQVENTGKNFVGKVMIQKDALT